MDETFGRAVRAPIQFDLTKLDKEVPEHQHQYWDIENVYEIVGRAKRTPIQFDLTKLDNKVPEHEHWDIEDVYEALQGLACSRQ
jgi:hypothetical protein